MFVTHSADEAVFLGSRIVVLTKSPETVALDLPIPLPRGDIDAEELRDSREFAELRAQVAHAVKAAAAP
ncbi:taurine transport system ATP-binding protein [Streptomyces sp. cf386]|nr:taurine transport system ATP-binding protein [Streptomyces sp. cf386]